jgi:hypothetical protein
MNVCMAAFGFDPLWAHSLFGITIADAERPLLWSGIVLLTLALGILGVWVYRLKTRTTSVPSAEELRGRLAQAVTVWAMVAIVALGITILAIAGYNAAATPSTEASREFIDTAKYIFTAVIPVVAGWVGTVMAFYFGKENLRAATETFG